VSTSGQRSSSAGMSHACKFILFLILSPRSGAFCTSAHRRRRAEFQMTQIVVAAARKSSLNLWALKNHLLTSQKKRCKLDRNNQDENHVRMHIKKSVCLPSQSRIMCRRLVPPSGLDLCRHMVLLQERATNTNSAQDFLFCGKNRVHEHFPCGWMAPFPRTWQLLADLEKNRCKTSTSRIKTKTAFIRRQIMFVARYPPLRKRIADDKPRQEMGMPRSVPREPNPFKASPSAWKSMRGRQGEEVNAPKRVDDEHVGCVSRSRRARDHTW